MTTLRTPARSTKEQTDLSQRARFGYDTDFRGFLQHGIAENLRPMPTGVQARALGVGNQTGGGYLVGEEFEAVVLQRLDLYSVMRGAATINTTRTGASLTTPIVDDTSVEGSLLSEFAGAAESDPTVGVGALPSYAYVSGIVKVSLQLLQDAGPDVEDLLSDLFARRIARITNRHFTVGTGANQPWGVATQAAVGVSAATGQTATVTIDDLLNLQNGVDAAHRFSGNAAYMMHEDTLTAVQKLADSNGRPIVRSWRERSQRVAVIDNYTVIVNPHMATMAAGQRSILFGDFSNYVIRDVQGAALLRFGELYIAQGQIGFLLVSRHSGQLMKAGGVPVAAYINSAT